MNTNLMNGKVCLITGASQGLGRHFSLVLAEAGATVVATSLKSEMDKLENLVQEITDKGENAIALDMISQTMDNSMIRFLHYKTN